MALASAPTLYKLSFCPSEQFDLSGFMHNYIHNDKTNTFVPIILHFLPEISPVGNNAQKLQVASQHVCTELGRCVRRWLVTREAAFGSLEWDPGCSLWDMGMSYSNHRDPMINLESDPFDWLWGWLFCDWQPDSHCGPQPQSSDALDVQRVTS